MNANGIRFDSFLPVWMVLSVAVLLGIFFVWKEFERKHGYRTLRIIAQIIAVISLTFLILRPSIKKEITTGSAILLTKGYDKHIADSLVSNLGLRVIRMYDADRFTRSKNVDSWHALNEDVNDIHFVLGEGIPAAALDEYNLHFNFIKGESSNGITQLNILPFKKNQLNFIQGRVKHEESAILKLIGPSGIEDSVQFNGKGQEAFSLSALAKQEGKFIYQLKLEANGKLLESGNLPIEVLPERKLNILFMQQYPTFEVRNLKNFLGEKGHAVTLRYQVSKNIYKYEYSNTENQIFSRLNNKVLDNIDLLITTPEALNDLSASEFQILQTSMEEGLGVIMSISQPLKKLGSIFPYELVPVNSDTVTLASEQWKEKFTFRSAAWRVKTSSAITGLFSDQDHNLISGYFYHGLGKVGFQLLSETYPILLKGKSQEYASLWSPLIEGTSRRRLENFKVHITSPFPVYPNEPIHFEVLSTTEAPELNFDNIRIPLKEDITVNQLWYGTVWAGASGWHQLSLQDSTKLNFYVSGKGEWQALRQVNQMQQNNTYLDSGDTFNQIVSEYQPVSMLLFFVLFILSSGGLWLLSKL